MDVSKVLAELHQELANVDAAILSLERLQIGSRRRGRPPALTTPGPSAAKSEHRSMSAGNRRPPSRAASNN
jgi:hypothetical protein